MKAIRYILAWILLPMMLAGCLDEYQELNTNPEQLATTDPRYVFTGATMNFTNQSRSHLTGKYGGVMVYMEYLVSASGPSAGYYVSPAKPNEHPQPYSPAYGDYYGTYGLRLDNLINMVIPKKDNAERYADVKAISQILLNYEQWRVLDTYGAAPITEAFRAQSDGNQTPRYDLYQEGIDGTPMYKKIDSEVKAAVETLKASNESQYALGGNDFFYSGDVKKWIKFGNTLRVKMAQRLEKADAAFYNGVVGEVLSSAANIMASNEESCVYHHTNEYNNNTDDIQDITSRYVASAAFVNFLKSCDDPRLPILVRRNGFGPGNNNKQNDEWFEIFKKEYPDYETRWPQFTGATLGCQPILTVRPRRSTRVPTLPCLTTRKTVRRPTWTSACTPRSRAASTSRTEASSATTTCRQSNRGGGLLHQPGKDAHIHSADHLPGDLPDAG